MDIVFALVSAITSAAYFVYASQIMKRSPGVSSGVTLGLSHLCGALFLGPLWFFMTPGAVGPDAVVPLFLTGALLVMSRELYFYAYARTDVANITVFSALTPVYTVATGYLFLKEVPTPTALVGLLLICGGIYALFLKRRAGMKLGAAMVQPFMRIVSSRPIFCAFLSTIPTAFAAVLQKHLMTSLDPVSFSFFLLLLIGAAALVISTYLITPAQVRVQTALLPKHFFLVSALLLPIMHVAFCLVMREHQAAMSLVLQRSSIVFQIVLAYIWLKEQQDIGKRLIVAAVIMLGFGLIIA